MSFKQQDADTASARREIKSALDQAQRGPAPEALTEADAQSLRHTAERVDLHIKSTRGELPKKH